MRQEHRELALALAAEAGVSMQIYSQYPMGVERSYDGSTIHITPGMTLGDAFHEVAHWLMATPRERGMVNFGLGYSPDDPLYKRLTPAVANSDDVERFASVLGICLLRDRVQPSVFSWEEERELHNWTWGGFCTVVSKLHEQNYFDCGDSVRIEYAERYNRCLLTGYGVR